LWKQNKQEYLYPGIYLTPRSESAKYKKEINTMSARISAEFFEKNLREFSSFQHMWRKSSQTFCRSHRTHPISTCFRSTWNYRPRVSGSTWGLCKFWRSKGIRPRGSGPRVSGLVNNGRRAYGQPFFCLILNEIVSNPRDCSSCCHG
jgi:hypothetical protein